MSNEELLARFERYLAAVLNKMRALNIQQKTATQSDAMRRCLGYVYRADRFLHTGSSVPDAPHLPPMNPEGTKQEALAVVESYAASHTLRRMTQNDCSLYREGSFKRDVLEIFFDFLQFLKATGVNP